MSSPVENPDDSSKGPAKPTDPAKITTVIDPNTKKTNPIRTGHPKDNEV